MAETHRCKPKNVSSTLKYSGEKSTVCQITVSNVSDIENCTWAARLDDEFKATSVRVVVASPVEGATIEAPPHISVGKVGPVQCKIEGGRPAPFISMEVKGLSKAEIVNSTQTQTPDKKGIYQTLQVRN